MTWLVRYKDDDRA